MATKKINLVFLNATDEQIKEYGLVTDVTNFSSMDKLIATVKADLEKKVPERVYSLKNGFTVIDGAADVSVDLKTIAKTNKYRLSAVDFDKIISEATKVLYSADGAVDHRIASFESVGEGEVSNLNMQGDTYTTISRSSFPATAAGEKAYQDAIAEAQEEAAALVSDSGSQIVGYKNLTLENVGVEAAATEEGEKLERETTITKPTTVSAIGGNNAIDYQYDSTAAVDKKDSKLVVENYTQKSTVSMQATGEIKVTNSQVQDIKGDLSDQLDELKNLHSSEDFDDVADAFKTYSAAGYETVTIDNSRVLGNIRGGSNVITKSSSGSKSTFTDKADLSGQFYAVDEANLHEVNTFSSENTKLYSYATDFVYTDKEAAAKATQLNAEAVANEKIENLLVNKYEIVELGLNFQGVEDFQQIKTGKYVYLTDDEMAALSDANQLKLSLIEEGVGFADYTANRQVTDDNFTTFTTAPSGNQLNTTEVGEYTFVKTVEGKKTDLGTYYLVDGAEAEIVKQALAEELELDPSHVSFSRVGETYGYRAAAEITAKNYKTEAAAAKVYAKYSDYSTYTFKKEFSPIAAAKANETLMNAEDQTAWVYGSESDQQTLFTVQKIVAGKATIYFLTAAELSSIGAFGKDEETKENIVRTTDEVHYNAEVFTAENGWCFVNDDEDLRLTQVDGAQIYRTGAAATEETLSAYTTLTDANSTTEEPYFYLLKDVVYDANDSEIGRKLNLDEFGAYLGPDGEYVVDGEIQYRAAGYNQSGNIQSSEYVSADAKTLNKAEYNYSASVGISLTEEDAEEYSASPTDGELTQNKLVFKDAYVAEGEDEYVVLDEEQDAYVHKFIDVYAAQNEANVTDMLDGGFEGLDTGIQAVDEGKKLYIGYSYTTEGVLHCKSTADATRENVAVNTYEDENGELYALTAEEAINKDLTLKIENAYYRSYAVNIHAGEALTSAVSVDELKGRGLLLEYKTENATSALDVCNTATAVYDEDGSIGNGEYAERLTVTVEGKEVDAFYNSVTHELTADSEATYNAVYQYTDKDKKTYYMTVEEAKAFTDLTKGAIATDLQGNSLYRIAEGTSAKLEDYTTKNYANCITVGVTSETYTQEFSEAWMAEDYVVGQQVYQYTKSGDATVYYMTENEAEQFEGLTQGEAVEGVVHYGKLDKETPELKDYTDATTRILDCVDHEDEGVWTITKSAEGKALQAVNADGAIYSNVDGTTFEGAEGSFVNYKEIAADATYFYTLNETKSYSDEEFAQLKANEESAGVATWKKTTDENGIVTWTRVAATGEISTYVADYANVKTANETQYNRTNVATGSIAIKNGSEIAGFVSGYKDVLITDSKVSKVYANNELYNEESSLSTKAGKIDADNRQTITTTGKSSSVDQEDTIGSFKLANSKDLLDDNGAIEQSASRISNYDDVEITNASVGTITTEGYLKSEHTSKVVTDYTGDADDLRADYINDYPTLANTGREGTGEASYVVSKITSSTNEYKNVSCSSGTVEVTGRDYDFSVADKNRANKTGSITGYASVTLTNVQVNGDVSAKGYEDSKDKESYSVKSDAKTGIDQVTNSGSKTTKRDSDGVLTAVNTVTDTANENDLTIESIENYQKVTLLNVGVNDDVTSQLKSTTTESGSATQSFDASTMRERNLAGSQKYDISAGVWYSDHYISGNSWDFTASDNQYKLTDSNRKSSTTSAPDAELNATGRFSTKAVENYATLNKYVQTVTGRELYLSEEEAKSLIGDDSTATGLKAGWTKDATQYYYRNSDDVVDSGAPSLNGVTATAKYTNGLKEDEEGYEEYFFTTEEAAIAKLDNAKITLATGTEASNRLRVNEYHQQQVGTTGYLTVLDTTKNGTTEVFKYVDQYGTNARYITAAEAQTSEYAGYTRDMTDTKTYIRRTEWDDPSSVKFDGSCFDKATASTVYSYTNKLDAEDVLYATENEFAILVLNGKYSADDYTKSETPVSYRDYGTNNDYQAVTVDNSLCNEFFNRLAQQQVSTVFRCKRTDKATFAEGANAYYLTAAEFAALSVKGGLLEGYELEEDAAVLVLRSEVAKSATKDNIAYFESVSQQGCDVEFAELCRTDLTDAEAKLLGVTYDEDQLRCYSANAVDEWEDAVKTTIDGDVANFKTVSLNTMNVKGSIKSGNDVVTDVSNSYSKRVSSKKGNDVYTEKDSYTRKTTTKAIGSIELVDTDVASGVDGYDKVSISTKSDTSTIGGITKTDSVSKYTEKANATTTDAEAYFEREYTQKTTNETTTTAKGDLTVAGLKAAEELTIDQSKHFDDSDDAVAEAQKQIDAADEKYYADIRITGDIKGFKNVSLTNVTIGNITESTEINAYSTYAENKTSKTTYTLTNNDKSEIVSDAEVGNTVTVISALDNSYYSNETIGGNLVLTNVNLAEKYYASSDERATENATRVNTYLYNGKYYALTGEEWDSFLPYGDIKAASQARPDDSIKTPAVEVIAGQTILTVTDNGKAGLEKDAIYYLSSKVVDPAAETKSYYYVNAQEVNQWLEENAGETIDTSKAYYADSNGTVIEKDDLIATNVAKYTYNGKTVYLTAAEADILGAAATADKTLYTRCSNTRDAVKYNDGVEAYTAEEVIDKVYKYLGTVKNEDGEDVEKVYYLTEAEFTGFTTSAGPEVDPVLDAKIFGKVDGTEYYRVGEEKTTFDQDALDEIDSAAICYGKVNVYQNEAGEKVYATEAEFKQLVALDSSYSEYKLQSGAVAYLDHKSIFSKLIGSDSLLYSMDKYQAVNESAEVYRVYNAQIEDEEKATVGYLTKTEYNALRDNAAVDAETFESIYKIDTTDRYLRIADDTNNIVKINGIDSEGYVVASEDTLAAYNYFVADTTFSKATAVANGFKSITMADSELSGADGSLTTEKKNSKLTSKKGDAFGQYTQNSTETIRKNVGTTFTAVDGVNNVKGSVWGYKTVKLAGTLTSEGYSLSNFGGFSCGTYKYVNSYSGKVLLKNDAYTSADIYDGKGTIQSTKQADGSLTATNVTLGLISKYKTVSVVFDATADEEIVAKHTIGAIQGGNEDSKTTQTYKTVGNVKITDSTTNSKFDSVGTATVEYATGSDISGYEKVSVTGSTVGTISGGKSVTKTVTLDMLDKTTENTTTSSNTVIESHAIGTATVVDSSIGGVSGFKKVSFTGGVKASGDVQAPVDNYDENSSRGIDNTVCYAVTYDYNYADKSYNNTVYLTVDEYKLFVKEETDAQIDLSVSTYRENAETETVADMYDFTENTDAAKKYTSSKGYNGANPVEVIVKSYGEEFTIDAVGAEIGGKVSGFKKVAVSGDANFTNGYEGTKNGDKLIVDADLATFGNFSFGEGKDTLELNGILGTNVDFEDWSLESVKGAGSLVVKADDALAVQTTFTSVKVYGSENYSAETALKGLTIDDAIALDGDRADWLGFCDGADYFTTSSAGRLSLDGDVFDSGMATAKVSYDDGLSWKVIEDGDLVLGSADIKVFLDEDAKNKISNDYTIAIKTI